MKKKLTVNILYKELLRHFGKQYWWPGETREEIIIGAVLTQNTNWANVEKAINNLKKNDCISLGKIVKLHKKKLSELIKPSGYFNIKAERLKSLAEFFTNSFDYNLKKWEKIDVYKLREQLLKVKGIGEETADSILNYAFDKKIFVVDAYTKRLNIRHRLIDGKSTYSELQKSFAEHLKGDVEDYKELHALIVMLGKNYCKTKPRCDVCPLNKYYKVVGNGL